MKNLSIEVFAEQALLCGEGPVWDEATGSLFWTDCLGDEIYHSSATEKKWVVLSKGIKAASLTLHVNGGLLCCGANGFFRLDKNGTVHLLNNKTGDIKATLVNDIIADPVGRVFGGQESFSDDTPDKTGFLFRMDIDGSINIVEDGLHLSNGMGFSPDCTKFYLVDTIPGKIYQYDFNVLTGNISTKKLFVTIPKSEGLPDGMTVDAAGFLWVARWFGYGLSRYDPDGKLERTITLPAAQISSLTFGGKDYNQLYITSAAMHWETSLAPDFHNYKTYRGGKVYRVIQDIQGKAEFKASI